MESVNPDEGDPDKADWKFLGLADGGEPEDFLAFISKFLASNNGKETCPNSRQIIETLFKSIADFLSTAHSSHHDTKTLIICFEALFTLLRTIPHGIYSQIDISPLSESLSQLAHTNHDGNISMQAQVNCLLALFKRLSVPSGLLSAPIGGESQPTRSYTTCLRCISLEADRVLHQVDTTRQDLEDNLVGNERGRVDKGCISESLKAHLNAITRGSHAIVECLEHPDADDDIARDILGDWSSYMTRIRQIIRSNSSSLKGEDLLSVSYHGIAPLDGATWSILSLAVIGYMRYTNVYPLLPDFSHSSSSGTSGLLEFWFPFLREADKRWISEPFARELRPLASAFNILVQDKRTTVQVQDLSLSSSYDVMDILRYSSIYSSPNLSAMGLPFSLLATINYATSQDCGIRGLLHLVSVFRTSHFSGRSVQEVQTAAGPIIGEALRILEEQFDTDWSKEPLLFTFSVLQKLFSWEREGSIFPFSDDNMDYIVNTIFLNILEKQDLVIPLDSDCADMIASLKGVCGDAHSRFGAADGGACVDLPILPLLDLRSLYNAPLQSGTLIARNQTNMTLPAIVPKFLEEKSYRRVGIREKGDICLRVMEWRKHQGLVDILHH
ncbi:hypothetical protein C0995_005981 [Termitomyces sp. Mi166|nr:hypothetical protein C0995_005981 [Termitomyces sp. Mi166\